MKNALVIILYDHPKEHTSDYVTQTCKYLSKNNTVAGILLKDALSLKEIIAKHGKFQWITNISPNWYEFQPLYILPFRRNKQVVKTNLFLNSVAIKIFLFFRFFRRTYKQKHLWLFSPEHVLMMNFFRSFSSIYDCVDYHESEKKSQSENQFIQTIDNFIVNSHVLYNIYKPMRKAVIVPQGFRLDEFQKNQGSAVLAIPQDKPVIGYVGGINYRLDYTLLKSLITRNPQYLFVFAGPIQHYETNVEKQPNFDFRYENVRYFGEIPKDSIPSLIQQFTISMIPYDIKYEFNKYCYPMKLFEYFYMGKPVLATPIEELKRFPKYVKIGTSVREWEENIKLLLSIPWSITLQNEQKRLAIENSWENKITDIEQVISL